MPHSGCTPGNVSTNYETYHDLRGGSTEGVALRKEELLTISVPDVPGQPAQPELTPPKPELAPPKSGFAKWWNRTKVFDDLIDLPLVAIEVGNVVQRLVLVR